MNKKSVSPLGTTGLQRNPRPILRAALIIAAYLLSFLILDYITKKFEVLPGIVAWYPPAGLTYALLLVFGVRFAPAVTIALFFSSFFIYRMPQPPYLLFLWAFIISLIYGLAAAFLRHRIRFDWHLRKLRDVLWFVFTTVVVSALLAVLSVSSSALSGDIPRSEILRAIFDWWIGETVGVLTVTPFLLIFVMPWLKRFADGQPVRLPTLRSFPPPTLSTIGQAASIVLTLYWVFGVPVLDAYHPLFLIALPLIWIAMTRGLKGISAAILALNSGVVLALWLFRFDFAQLGELELLLIVNCIVGLLMGAVVSEQKQAGQILSESENRFRSLLENSSDLVLVLNPDFTLTYISPSVERLLGYTVKAVVGNRITDYINPLDLPDLIAATQHRTLTPGLSTFSMLVRVRHADGSWRTLEGMGSNLLDQPGVSGLVINARDVTERQRREAERQALLEIMQGVTITENLQDLLELIRQSLAKVIYAENFFVVFKNKSTGLFEEVFAVDKYDSPMPPSKLERSITSYVFRTGEPLLLTQAKFEELVRRGEAELVGTKPAVWLGAPLKTTSETIGVIVVQNYEDPDCYSERDKDFLASIGMQVSLAIVRKQAEDKLEEERILLRTLIDNLPDRIYVIDDQGRKLLSNSADWQASGGKRMEDVIGKTDFDTYPPELAKEYWAIDRAAIDTGISIINHEEPGLDSQGDPAWVLSSKVPLRNGQGKVVGLVGIGHDITERKQAEEERRHREMELQESQRIARIGSWEWVVATGVIVWSDGMNNILAREIGLPSPTFETLSQFYTPESWQRLGVVIANAVETGASYDIEVEMIRSDGTTCWTTTRGEAIRAADGSVVRLRGTVLDITERKQREEELRSRTDELTMLYQLSRALADTNDLENLFDLVNRHAVESVHTTFACIALLEDGDLVKRAVFPVRSLDHAFNLGSRQPITALPFCQRVLEKNEPVILSAGSSEVGSPENITLLLDFVQSVCLVPLRVGDSSQGSSQVLGLLILGEARAEKREPFTPEKIRLARSIGDQAAAAIRRLLLREQAGRRLQQLASLSEIDRTIASNFDLRVSLQMILKHASEQLKMDAADVLVFNDRLQTLVFTAGHGFRSTAVERRQLRIGEGQAGQAALERRIVIIPDVAASGVAFTHPELLEAEHVAAYFAVPMIAKGQVKGVMEIFHRTPLEPNDEWLDFLNTLAGQGAIAIDVVHLFDSLQLSNTELALAYDATIEGWSHALDLRDKETEGHTQRVTEMTVNLARTFGLSDADLVQARWGALLHDIGKMGVPDGILLKPGPLTDNEWVVMKKHPTFAHDMLAPIRYLRLALDIPYCHHEKWDGTGYPRGLKGEQIPLTARIFAVVDVWDALISDRPYRKAWSKAEAIAHIKSGSGTHFDPQVVKICLESGLLENLK